MSLDELWLNQTLNMTLEEYLMMMRGPKRLPLEVVVPITVIYCTIFLTGVLGNLAICVVIATNANMHTATNYYLFSLAVSDVTLLLLGNFLCSKPSRNHSATPFLIQLITTNASEED
ncbi:hypothetical protein J6590_063113 [Homalodisca vitripennis]|nr:hypothetical protein J6590_063113 [Homalodisca vitripennis]